MEKSLDPCIQSLLSRGGFDVYDEMFRLNDISFEMLPELTDLDLAEMGVLSAEHRVSLLEIFAAAKVVTRTSGTPDPRLAGFLTDIGLVQYLPLFVENDIDIELIRTLDGNELAQIGVKSLGHRKLLLREIAGLRQSLPSKRTAAEGQGFKHGSADVVVNPVATSPFEADEILNVTFGLHPPKPMSFAELLVSAKSGQLPPEAVVSTQTPPSRSMFARDLPGLFVRKSRVVCALLALFLGIFGIDRIYVGHVKVGVAKAVIFLLGLLIAASSVSVRRSGLSLSTGQLGFGAFLLYGGAIWAFVDFILAIVGFYKRDGEGQPIAWD